MGEAASKKALQIPNELARIMACLALGTPAMSERIQMWISLLDRVHEGDKLGIRNGMHFTEAP